MTIANLYNNGNINDLNTFIEGVVTASGTQYYLMIDNPSEFAAFASSLTTMSLDSYRSMYERIFHINSSNTVEMNEASFINYLDLNKTGMKLFKGNSNMTNWSALSIGENNGVEIINCNNN